MSGEALPPGEREADLFLGLPPLLPPPLWLDDPLEAEPELRLRPLLPLPLPLPELEEEDERPRRLFPPVRVLLRLREWLRERLRDLRLLLLPKERLLGDGDRRLRAGLRLLLSGRRARGGLDLLLGGLLALPA